MYALPTILNAGRPVVTLVPISDGLDARVRAAAAADGHGCIHPTHAVLRGDEVVGYASLGRVRLFFTWLDSRKLSGPESHRAWRQCEEILAAAGSGPVCLPCTAGSPLRPFVERLGYGRMNAAELFLKG